MTFKHICTQCEFINHLIALVNVQSHIESLGCIASRTALLNINVTINLKREHVGFFFLLRFNTSQKTHNKVIALYVICEILVSVIWEL